MLKREPFIKLESAPSRYLPMDVFPRTPPLPVGTGCVGAGVFAIGVGVGVLVGRNVGVAVGMSVGVGRSVGVAVGRGVGVGADERTGCVGLVVGKGVPPE